MQLHFSWTVLATIIWTILLDSSAKGTISKKRKLLGLEENSIGVARPIDTSWKLENTIKTIQYVGPNVETKSPSDITKRRIITENDLASKMVGNAVEKHHVREQSLSQETPISSKYGRNNGNLETGEYRGRDNDGVSIFQHRSKASLKRNIPMMHYADGGMSLLNKHQLNVPRKLTTERGKLKYDNVLPDRASTKASLYDQKEEAVNTIETSATSVSLINGSNTSGVNYQSLESSSHTHIAEYDNSTHLTLPKWNRSMEKPGFVGYSSLNDNSSAKDQPLHKAFSKAQTSREHQGVSSPVIQDPLPSLQTNSTIDNIAKKKKDEKVFPRKVQYLLGKRSLVWEKQRDKNVLGSTRENIFINGPLESNKILESEANEKTKSSRRQRDPNISKELSNIETADAKEVEKLTKRQLDIQENLEDSAVSTLSQIPANLLDQEANRVPESSSLNDVSLGLTMSGKVSPETSKGFSGQIGGSSTHIGETETDSLTETTNDQGCKHIAKLPFGWRSLPKDFTDSRHLDKLGPSSPEEGESHSQRKFRKGLEKINYLEDGKVEHRSLSVPWLNNKDTKRDEAGIIDVNKNSRKDFEELSMNDLKNNVPNGSSMSRVGDNNKISRWNQESEDNPSSQDIKLKVHGKVVKTKLTSSLRDRRAHKTFIDRNSVGDTNLGSYQTPQGQVQLQESKKYQQKLTFDTTPLELNGILGWQDVASSVEKTLANSEASSSLWPEVERENTLSDSNVRANAVGTRRMELSGEDTRGSRKIRFTKKDSARKKNFLSEEPSKVEPRSKQFLQASSTERNTSGDDAVFSQENRENSIQEIFQPVRTDTSPSIGLRRAQIYSRSSASDRNDHPVHETDRKITGRFESLESKPTPDREKFHRITEDDRRTKITSSFLEKPDGEVVSLHPKGDRIQWTDAGLVTSAVGKSKTPTTFRKMARAQFADRLNNKTMQSHNHSRATEILTKQENYIREVQTKETNKISMINRSEPRDQIYSDEDDSLEKQRKERNHSTNRIHKVVDCDTCKATDDDTKKNGPSRTFHFAHYKERSNKKVARSVTETSVPNSLLPLDITRGNGVSLDSTVTDSHGNSLGGTSTKLEAIAHSEKQAVERLGWKNFGTLVRRQQKILDEPTLNDFDLSREPTSTPQPPAVNIEKFRDADERNGSVERVIHRSNGSSSLPHDEARTYEDDSSSRKPVDKYEKFEMRPSRSNEALRNESRKKFSDNSDDVSRDQRNSRPSSTFSEENVSGNVNSVKISVHNDTATTATMDSMKIDSSISLIDQASRRVDFAGKKKYIGNVAPHILLGGNGEAIEKTYDGNVKGKQMKSGFTKDNSDSVATTESTMSDSPDYETSQKQEIDNVPSSAVDDDVKKAAKVTNKILLIPVADLTMSDFPSSQTFDPTYSNLTSNSSNPNDSPMTNSSRTLEAVPNKQQKSQSHQARLRPSDNMEESIDARILNQTVYDNSTRVTNTLNQWPVKHSAVVEGDLVLGGLMMVHEREDSVTCGPVMPQGGVQALEAMLYTLDWLNKRDLVPGVKIGAHILDDCDKDTYGLEMAVDFIKGSISNIDGAEYHCNKTAVRKVISGVVGAASSVTSIQVANLLRLFRIPQVSFFSTSPELSNKMRFEYFTRTIPSDHYQVKAMVDIVLEMGWSYVSIIYEESNYGEKAYEELEKLLGKHQICIAVKEKLSKDSGVAEAHVYDNIVQKLLTKPRARGCIIFASDQEVAGVMRAVRRCNATGAFSWIGSDGWSARSLVSDGNEREMEGTLSVQPQANPVQGFEDYFLNLTVENNRRNPWFVEFWEDHFKCRYPNSSRTPYNNYTEECTTTERLTKEDTAFEDQLQFVSDAVLAFAHAFRNMHSTLCHGKPGLCDAMKPTKGIELLNYLRNVEFDGLTGDVFHFDKNGDGPARYNIIHFKQVSPGEYKWIRVGKYLEGELRLNMSEIQFRLGSSKPPESVCSLPCEMGQAKKYVEGESCCWHCFNCSQDEIRHITDEKRCVPCPKGTLPDENHSYCRDIPEEFLRPESGWAIGAMSFSSTGILITLFVGGVFLKHNDTPIVRASGRELSYVLLTGILLCYLVTFALILRPTDLVCSIQRFSAGFCFTVMYAALLTKTNRISRIFNAGKRSAKRPSFISPRSQLIICSMLVAVQILIHAVWMVIDPAKARHHYPTREDNLLVCNSYIDASYMIAFTYPIILIVVCTVYAVLTRKIPEAFNESKHIGFTMYTTCVIWLAFVPLYFATGSHVALRITSMSVTISLSATVTIACLFTPKLYIILIHPERNVRPNMMHHRYNTTKGSVVTATNASSMMAPVTLTAITCDQNKAVKKHAVTTIDCSTQSEQLEMETKERQNGKIPAALINRSTQTMLNNNGTDTNTATSPVIKEISMDENNEPVKSLIIGKIGNGPLAQNEIPL